MSESSASSSSPVTFFDEIKSLTSQARFTPCDDDVVISKISKNIKKAATRGMTFARFVILHNPLQKSVNDYFVNQGFSIVLHHIKNDKSGSKRYNYIISWNIGTNDTISWPSSENTDNNDKRMIARIERNIKRAMVREKSLARFSSVGPLDQSINQHFIDQGCTITQTKVKLAKNGLVRYNYIIEWPTTYKINNNLEDDDSD